MKISLFLILLLLTIISASAQASGNSNVFSIVHISDTQYLAALYPETYD